MTGARSGAAEILMLAGKRVLVGRRQRRRMSNGAIVACDRIGGEE